MPEQLPVAGQDTAHSLSVANLPRIIERKVKPDGRVQEFDCVLVHRAPGLVIVRFVIDVPFFETPMPLEAGSVSDGYFWTRRPYSLYRMRSPRGDIIAHRFDAVGAVTIEQDAVTFRDLILDWWALADGTFIEEDRDEFDALVAAGKLGTRDLHMAQAAAREVTARYRHIIEQLPSPRG